MQAQEDTLPASNEAASDNSSDSKSDENTAINASAWTLAGYGASQIVRFVGNMLLSYWVLPEAFGILALANVFWTGVQMCSDIGVMQCVVRDPDGTKYKFYNTAWTIQAIRGVIVWLLLALLASPVAYFYDEPRLFPVICLLGLSAFALSLKSAGTYLAQRQMQLGRIMTLEVGSQFVGTALTVGLVMFTNISGVYALVSGALTTAFSNCLLSYVMFPEHLPRPMWDSKSAGAIARFGAWILVGTIVAFLAIQIDRMMLGRLVPFEVLGIYHMGLMLTMFTIQAVEKLSASVQYPILSAIAQNSGQELSAAIDRTRTPLLQLATVMTLCVFAGAPLFFDFFYHENYSDAGAIARLMCCSVWFIALSKTIDRTLLALGDSRSLAAAAFIRLVFTTTLGLFGYWQAELDGFCYGMIAGSLLSHLSLYPFLAKYGVNCIWQDLRHTIYTALGLLSVLALNVFSQEVLEQPEYVAQLWGIALATAIAACTIHTTLGKARLLRKTSAAATG